MGRDSATQTEKVTAHLAKISKHKVNSKVELAGSWKKIHTYHGVMTYLSHFLEGVKIHINAYIKEKEP